MQMTLLLLDNGNDEIVTYLVKNRALFSNPILPYVIFFFAFSLFYQIKLANAEAVVAEAEDHFLQDQE